MKNKKRVWFTAVGLALLMLVVVGGSLAFYTSSGDADNRLVTKSDNVFLSEIFNPADKWVPGETKQKEVWFGNTGETDQILRVKAIDADDILWYDNKGTPNNLNDDTLWTYTGTYSPAPAVINWTRSSGTSTEGPDPTYWVRIGDWYYYKKVLPMQQGNTPGLTPCIISSVSFSNAISNAGPGHADDFSDKRISLTVEAETMDVHSTVTAAEWGVSFTQSGSDIIWTAVNP